MMLLHRRSSARSNAPQRGRCNLDVLRDRSSADANTTDQFALAVDWQSDDVLDCRLYVYRQINTHPPPKTTNPPFVSSIPYKAAPG